MAVPDRPRIEGTTHYEWDHGVGEIVSALIEAGLVELLRGHQNCLWQALPYGGWWCLPERPERLPLMYSIRARKA